MSLYDFFMYACVVLLLIIACLNFYNAWYFRKHKEAYDIFLDEYKRNGLQLDLTTNVASYLGFYANYQKIAFFVNLKKDKKMRFSRTEPVNEKAYTFVQNQPESVTGWMVKLFSLYQLSFFMTFLWAVFAVIFIFVFN